ncbi:putative porin, partial [Veillonella intestinalis]
AEQQALINRLADEFSSELNNLGVRVATLENKVGNIKATGDVRLRYKGFEDKGNFSDSKDKKSKFDMRGRVQFNAQVNENTTAVIRLTSGDLEFHNAKAESKASIDQVYVAHKFGKDTTAVLGRFTAVVGNGLVYDDTFDGAAVAYNNGNFSATAAYGSFQTGSLFSGYDAVKKETVTGTKINGDAEHNYTVTLLQAKGNLGEHATLGGFYAFTNNNLENDIYGGSLDLNFKNVWVGGEYATFDKDWVKGVDNDGNDAWVAGVGFGNYNIKEQGTWGVKVQYFDLAKHSPVISSTWNQPYNSNYKTWMATVNYALAENVGLSGYWAFNGEDQDGKDIGDFYRAQLDYKF